MNWFTSDWHFGHRNVINYCNRPFATVEEMNDKLIDIWNSTVKDEDTIYFLGDFSLSPRWSSEILPKLKGTKILVCGNHDACWPFHHKEKHKRKAEKMLGHYLQDGWKAVHANLNIKLSNGQEVLLSHLPYANPEGSQYDNRYSQHKPIDKGLPLLHGHLHKHYLKFKRMIDVGIDGSFKMLSEDDVIALIADKREFIPSEITEFYKNRPQRENMVG